ncbi:1127_t:CDS:2, partial [Paraglomus occultum]
STGGRPLCKESSKIVQEDTFDGKISIRQFYVCLGCLHSELNEIASIHSTFMKKINEEVEAPIRDISTSEDWVKVKE